MGGVATMGWVGDGDDAPVPPPGVGDDDVGVAPVEAGATGGPEAAADVLDGVVVVVVGGSSQLGGMGLSFKSYLQASSTLHAIP